MSSNGCPTDNSDLLSYPHSRTSVANESDVVRSRTWSEDITKTWNAPIIGLESLANRIERYRLYFQLTSEQLRCIYEKFVAEMRVGLEVHRTNPKGRWDPSKCSLKMSDTCVDEHWLLRGKEVGSAVTLDFGSTEPGSVRASRVALRGAGSIQLTSTPLQLRDVCTTLPKGLLDKNATASQLFDAFSEVVATSAKDLLESKSEDDPLPVAFSLAFPLEQRAITNASLIHWTRGCETGRATIDPVEGMDVAALLDCGFWRSNVAAKTVAVLNHATAVLLCCAYEKAPRAPSCRVAFILGNGVNGCYNQADAVQAYNYKSTILNCELGNFDKCLPANDVDLEIDFADEATKGLQLFEKMVSSGYLGELCRRLVLKVWQNEAPPLAWVRYSMPWLACAKVIGDDSESMDVTGEILTGLWEWNTSIEQRRAVKLLFGVVFDRSAALAAVALMALASQTERLQPAMGGLTCAIEGALFSKCPFYRKALESYLSKVLDNNTSNLVHLQEVVDGAAKGAAALALSLTKS